MWADVVEAENTNTLMNLRKDFRPKEQVGVFFVDISNTVPLQGLVVNGRLYRCNYFITFNKCF